MSNLWEENLKRLLASNKKKAVLCIGNRFRMDDAVACLLCDRIKGKEDLIIINAESNPENYIDTIAREKVQLLIIIDAANFGGEEGEIRFVGEDQISCLTLSTHSLPLSLILSMIRLDISQIEAYFIGIQISRWGFGEELSPGVLNSLGHMINIFKECGYA